MKYIKPILILLSTLAIILIISIVWNWISWEINKGTPKDPMNKSDEIDSDRYCESDSDCMITEKIGAMGCPDCGVESINTNAAKNRIGPINWDICPIWDCAIPPSEAKCVANECIVEIKEDKENPPEQKIIDSRESPIAGSENNYLYYMYEEYMYEEWGNGVDYYEGNEISYTTVKEVVIDKDQCLAMMNERDIDPKTVFVANYSYQSNNNDLVTLEAKTSLSIPDYWEEDDRLVEFGSSYGIQPKTPTTPRDLEFIVKARGCHDEAQIEIYNVDTGVTLGTVDVTEEKYPSKAD